MENVIGIGVGKPLPLGVQRSRDRFNFSVFARNATALELLLFKDPHDPVPAIRVPLDPIQNRTGDIWHVSLAEIGPATAYGFRADGPFLPDQGHRYNPERLLLDPYARAIGATDDWDFARLCPAGSGDIARSRSDIGAGIAKSLIVDGDFDWDGDRRPRNPWSETVIYETHVRGLTADPSSKVSHAGTFLGVIEKIPYFQRLGITALELMPVQEFHESDMVRRVDSAPDVPRNYWGYDTVGFFAPKESYSTLSSLGCQVNEFKTMVRELHRVGIEVILDVVFNHTAEADEAGPTLHFRGFDNSIYYMLQSDKKFYKDYTGCGNTVNCNHPVVRDFVIDCLRYWVFEMHVDGFRFDLASVLGRSEKGELLPNPPLLESITEDPILRDVKLIAEAWDAGGAFQLGHFPRTWGEWNCHFRDDVRRFWRGDPGMTGALATRLSGSADFYQRDGKEPINSINFITCHDGFTLNDLVSYRAKHNEANFQHNRDGANENFSENYGTEGPANDDRIEKVRIRQMKNMFATLLLSRGVPMILGGDEFRRSQRGNNNAYCQDNEISWYDWMLLDGNLEIFDFAQSMIKLRSQYSVLRAPDFYTETDISWFGPNGAPPEWNGHGGILGAVIRNRADTPSSELCMLLNATSTSIAFALPPALPAHRWHLAVDTAGDPRHASLEAANLIQLTEQTRYILQERALAVLLSREPSATGR